MLTAQDAPVDVCEDARLAALDGQIGNLEDGSGHVRSGDGERYSDMSEKSKPATRPEDHMEKPVMQEPQEEFVADQSVPSRDIHDAPRKQPAEPPRGNEE